MSAGLWFRSVEVVHAVRGRLRLRCRRNHGTPPFGSSLAAALSLTPGVREARFAPRINGVVLTYDPAETDGAALVAAVAGLQAPASAAGDLAEAAQEAASLKAVALAAAPLLAGPFLPPYPWRVLSGFSATLRPIIANPASLPMCWKGRRWRFRWPDPISPPPTPPISCWRWASIWKRASPGVPITC